MRRHVGGRRPGTLLGAWLAAGALACGSDDPGPVGPTPPDPDPPPAPNVEPTARFTADTDEGRAPVEVSFDATSSTDPDGRIVTWAWTFGDGSTATGAQVRHTFADPGFFLVSLTVTDDRGGQDVALDSVYVSSAAGPGDARIAGTVWFDRDLDGEQGADEPGLPRWTVFLDDDGDGAVDAGEPLAFTGPGGSYAFEGVDAGAPRTVTQVLPFGWTSTSAGVGAGGVGRAPSGRPVAATGAAGEAARIIDGEEVSIEAYPYQVALMVDDFQFCGGTLVAARWVLTAAHCVDGSFPTDFDILYGTAQLGVGGERVAVEAIRIHPDYRGLSQADVAMLRLAGSLLHPRVFVQAADQPSFSTPGDTATVIGWGRTEAGSGSPVLLGTDLAIITNTECENIAGALFQGIGPGTLCAGGNRIGTGPCFGDSGGPLLVPGPYRAVEIGVVSRSVNVDQCGNVPGAFARVTTIQDWILGVGRSEASLAVEVTFAAGSDARVDFGNYH